MRTYYFFLLKIHSQRHCSPLLAKPTVLERTALSPSGSCPRSSVREKLSVRTRHTLFGGRGFSPAAQEPPLFFRARLHQQVAPSGAKVAATARSVCKLTRVWVSPGCSFCRYLGVSSALLFPHVHVFLPRAQQCFSVSELVVDREGGGQRRGRACDRDCVCVAFPVMGVSLVVFPARSKTSVPDAPRDER